jgi:DNA-binding CsgD family transcriptional regulator
MEELLEFIRRRSAPGILIFDMNDRLIYLNQEVLTLIPEMKKTMKTGGGIRPFIPEVISKLCNSVKKRIDTTVLNIPELNGTVFVGKSGVPYSVRSLPVGERGDDKKPTHILILVEKIVEKRAIDFEKARNRFQLTNRELELLVLLCDGITNRDISEKLFLSEHTVKDHIKNIMRKMGVDSRGGIIAAILR